MYRQGRVTVLLYVSIALPIPFQLHTLSSYLSLKNTHQSNFIYYTVVPEWTYQRLILIYSSVSQSVSASWNLTVTPITLRSTNYSPNNFSNNTRPKPVMHVEVGNTLVSHSIIDQTWCIYYAFLYLVATRSEHVFVFTRCAIKFLIEFHGLVVCLLLLYFDMGLIGL